VVEGWVSLRDAIADGQRRLASAGVPSPDTDAMLLAAHVKGVPRSVTSTTNAVWSLPARM
jgi:hypothetical protein